MAIRSRVRGFDLQQVDNPVIDKAILSQNGVCPVCSSTEATLSTSNKNTFSDNFYLEGIRDQLGVSLEYLKNVLKVYECSNCGTLYCDPWFDGATSFRLFNEIYSQHNRGWDALYGWLKDKEIQDYWAVLECARKQLGEVKFYAEYHCPFQGNFFKFRALELPNNKRRDFYRLTRKYLLQSTPRKWLFSSQKLKSLAVWYGRKFYRSRLDRLDINIKLSATRRYLVLAPSTRFWDYGCISSGVNCKQLAAKLLNLSVMTFDEMEQQNQKVDVFAFINTLDHTHQPLELLERAINISKSVIIINHAQEIISKQHKFVFRSGLVKYLNRRKDLSVVDFTDCTNPLSDESNRTKIALLILKTD